MNQPLHIVIIGATSAIAIHCARLWAQQQAVDFTLVGRDRDRLQRLATDLAARNPQARIDTLQTDFTDPTAIQACVSNIVARASVDIALIAHGSLPDQGECQSDLHACRAALDINGISPVLFAEAFAGHMAHTGRGRIALISSVAGDRGRKSNYVYGAAKGLVSRYAQGLQHRLASSGVSVTLIKPGPTDTPMTAHLKAEGARLAPVEEVARRTVAAIEAGKATVYVPGKWWLIMMIIRHLPAFLFNRMNI